jgi:two-component system, response regulator PdtaR
MAPDFFALAMHYREPSVLTAVTPGLRSRMSVILTVEDEFLIAENLGEILKEAGFQVVAAASADEAIAILEQRDDIRIVITDINMPGSMDGLKLAAAVKHRWPPIKIIVATGRAPPRVEELPVGTHFLPKPYAREKVLATIQHIQ